MQKQNYFAALTLVFGCFFTTHSFATAAKSYPDIQSKKSEEGKIISLNSSAMLLPDPCQIVYTGSIVPGDPLQTGRLLRNGIASSCENLKGSPGLNDATIMRYYDSYSYTNTENSSKCLTVTISSCGINLFHAAYLNTFNPAAPAQNYLADPGASSALSSYSFNLPANSTAVFVVHGVNSGSTCDAYTLTINQCPPCDAAISNVSATAESCLGNDDGTLTVTASCTTCSALEYSINGTDWQPGSTFNGLPPANYTVTVRDAGDESCSASTSAIVNPGTPGNALEQTNVVYHNPNSVTVYWSTIPGSTNYMMRYRPVGGAWTEITSLRAWRRLYSLSACTPYEVQFKNYIGGMWTCWSQFYYFTTPCAKTFGTGKNNNDLSAGMQVFPNPVSEVLNIVLDENMLDKAVTLTLRDQLGRDVWNRKIQNLETTLVELNVREYQLATGVYTLSLQNADCVTTAQIVVNR